MTLPNFFLVGAMKAGTTLLYKCLSQHPEIFSPVMKEPHYFIWGFLSDKNYFEVPGWKGEALTTEKWSFVDTQKAYESLFKGSEKYKLRFEASTHYLSHPESAKNIHSLVPDAKIIASLRAPAKMAFSAFNFNQSRAGELGYTFRQALEEELEGKRDTWWYGYRYIHCGKYYTHLKRFYDVFGRENVKVILFDDFVEDSPKVLHDIYTFLGADPSVTPNIKGPVNKTMVPTNTLAKLIRRLVYKPGKTKNVLKKAIPFQYRGKLKDSFGNYFNRFGAPPGKMQEEDIELLQKCFGSEIKKLEQDLGRDLSDWNRWGK